MGCSLPSASLPQREFFSGLLQLFHHHLCSRFSITHPFSSTGTFSSWNFFIEAAFVWLRILPHIGGGGVEQQLSALL